MDKKASALLKIGDKILNAFSTADYFKKRRDLLQQPYEEKILVLKEALTIEYKRCIENSKVTGLFAMKKEVIEKHIKLVKNIQNKKILKEDEKQIIDTLISKYT